MLRKVSGEDLLENIYQVVDTIKSGTAEVQSVRVELRGILVEITISRFDKGQ